MIVKHKTDCIITISGRKELGVNSSPFLRNKNNKLTDEQAIEVLVIASRDDVR